MDRRTAISRIGMMLGGTLSASTLSALVAGCAAPASDDFTPQYLTAFQLDRLGRIVDLIIPETDTPGARAAGVHRFIDTLLAEYLPRVEARNFLEMFDGWSADHAVDKRTEGELEARLKDVDRSWAAGAEEPVWGQIKSWTVAGYYTSEIGMTQELRMKPFTQARMDMPRSEIERTWAK
jgi:gluconate 2-dehydrogenase gamma chain